MNKSIVCTLLACFVAIFISGCKSVESRPVNSQQSKLGVLVLAGEGLNSGYNEAWSSSFVFEASAKVAAAVQKEIQHRGTSAQVFLSRDRSVNPRKYLGELLSQDKRDGLFQVNIIHKKQGDSYSITLSLRYNPLQWGEDPTKGQNIITLSGPTANYSLGNDESFSDEKLKGYAQDFVARLYAEGFIGK